MFLTRERHSPAQPLLQPHNNHNNSNNSQPSTDQATPLLNHSINVPRTTQRHASLHVRDSTRFPTGQLALLALVRLAEPVALTSIFPYAWKQVLHFEIGHKSDASFYAGLLIAAFALAESITGMFWGSLSDRVGRKPILLLGCAGTALSLLVVGFSSNFWMALFGRALGGLLNGNVGVIQTMVGELVTRPEHEPRAYAVMPFVWSIGTIIGPAIGGTFSNPSENFPSVFSSHGLFARYPYLLPNVICAAMLVVAISVGLVAIEETHPDRRPWCQPRSSSVDASTEITCPQLAGATEHAPADLSRESYGTFNAVDVQEDSLPALPLKQTIFTRRVVMLVAALGIFSYHCMTFEVIWSIFLQDDRTGDGVSAMSTSEALAGGLGMTTQQVGIIMSFNGLIALFVQGVIFPFAASWLGVWKLFVVVTVCHPMAYFLVPYLAFLTPGALYPGIYALLSLRNLFSILAYPVLLILIKEASPAPESLGRINGLAASVGAACRTLASPVAGLLYGVGMKIDFTPLAWWASGAVALVGAIQVFFMTRQKDTTRVRDLRQFASMEFVKSSEGGNRSVQITVQETSEYSDEEAQ